MVSVEYAGGSMGLTVCSLVMMVDEWLSHGWGLELLATVFFFCNTEGVEFL